jgi:hypothetical protein
MVLDKLLNYKDKLWLKADYIIIKISLGLRQIILLQKQALAQSRLYDYKNKPWIKTKHIKIILGLRQYIFNYIEVFYYRVRLHSSNDYKATAVFEENMKTI